MRLLTSWDVFSGCAWYRCVLPAMAAADAGHDVSLRQGTTPRDEIEWCDVFHVQRLFQSEAAASIKLAKRLGKLVVYDVDDDLWAIGPANSAQAFWEDHKGDAVQVMRLCDRVTTTNDYLAGILSKFHQDVRVVPNALTDDFVNSGKQHEGVVIGWAGGNSHREDIEAIADVIYEVLDSRDVTFEIVVSGDHVKWLDHERIVWVKSSPIEQYHLLLSRFDIGLAPLTDTRFNRAKSDLKPHEYMGVGIPWIASKVGPYTDLPHGKAGYLASNSKDWRKYLLRLIDDADLRKRMGEEGTRCVRRLDATLNLWMDAWSR